MPDVQKMLPVVLMKPLSKSTVAYDQVILQLLITPAQ